MHATKPRSCSCVEIQDVCPVVQNSYLCSSEWRPATRAAQRQRS